VTPARKISSSSSSVEYTKKKKKTTTHQCSQSSTRLVSSRDRVRRATMSEDGHRAAFVVAGVAFGVSAFAASLVALRAASMMTARRDPLSTTTTSSVDADGGERRAALVLIAHPDDESYFFGPTVQALKRANVETHLVCLSDGGGGGDGETRKKELLRVKEFFGLEGMCIVETDDLQDGMDREWPAKTVMAVLDAYTEGAPVAFDYVVTFDAGGVSGHVNHVGTHEGARQWIEERKQSVVKASEAGKCPQVWVLETTNVARKFSSAVDWFASYIECMMDSRRVFVPSPSPLEVLRAVRLHKSQFVWYRKLFVAFSRYTYMNTLRRID